MKYSRYQIIGGFQALLGGVLFVSIVVLAVLFTRYTISLWLLLFLSLVALLLLAAGVLVWQRKSIGLTLSLILQGLAMIDLETRWIDWSFYFNTPGFFHLDLNIDINLEEILRSIGVNNPTSPLVIGVDVLSAIIFYNLWQMRRERRKQTASISDSISSDGG